MSSKILCLAIYFSCALISSFAQQPVIRGVKANAGTVEQYAKFEAILDISATLSNPYDYDEIQVVATFTAPDKRTFTVDGFFMQEYSLNAQGVLGTPGTGDFRVRFAPDQAGVWSYVVTCSTASGKAEVPVQSFTCTPATSPSNKGFVRKIEGNYFRYDQGDPFIPVGENIGWQNGNPFTDYSNWLGKLHENKGNFFRIWQAHWGLGIEWRNGSSGFQGLRKYKQTNAAYLDWLMEYCAEKGIYMMFCLQHHGQVSSTVNPNWNDSPYNAAHGGPCARTWDFFTNPVAKNHTRNRLRYTIARWGYARSIMSWELFNEVDWTDDFDNRKSDVAAWHREMGDFIRTTDPNKRFITTSFGRDQHDPALWSTPSMDFTQTHFYLDIPNLERAIGTGTRQYLKDYSKPTFNGEFGLGGSAESLANIDANGIYVHNAIWGSLFSGGAGAGLTWWWDNYIHPRNLYYHFAPLSAVAARIPFSKNSMASAPVRITGAPADLSLTPSLGWGGLGALNVAIGANGTDAALGSYLYGAQWNTQFRRPPTFSVEYPVAGKFTVVTGTTAGTNPRINITLDGKVVLDNAAAINQSYTIDVPSGPHTIKVDNTGTDWITIKSYVFSGMGSAVDAYALLGKDRTSLSAWILNHSYNHVYVKSKGLPPPVTGAVLQFDQLKDGAYLATWYNCLTGAQVREEPVTVIGGQLNLPIPELSWDLALFVQGQSVATREKIPVLDFRIFPNPLPADNVLHLEFDLQNTSPLNISLLDASGREVKSLFSGNHPTGPVQLALPLPARISGGVYWIRVQSRHSVGVKPLIINKER